MIQFSGKELLCALPMKHRSWANRGRRADAGPGFLATTPRQKNLQILIRKNEQ